MTWKQIGIGFAFGVLIDIGLVWLYYKFIGEPFSWTGFWIWQGILWGAGVLLWARNLLGFSVWYLFYGREALAREAFDEFAAHQFNEFDGGWDDVVDWLNQHIERNPRSDAASAFAIAWALTRQRGFWQYWMMLSAHKKAALRYGKALKRRQALSP